MSKCYIAIDFDGTIVEHMFPRIGRDIGAFSWIKKFKEAGVTLILYTMRSDGMDVGDVLTDAVEHCRENGVEFDLVNENPQAWTDSPKIYAHIYIDDHGFGCPLIENPQEFQRPYVDWEIVGPAVLKQINERLNNVG